jgi:hypothetical protein
VERQSEFLLLIALASVAVMEWILLHRWCRQPNLTVRETVRLYGYACCAFLAGFWAALLCVSLLRLRGERLAAANTVVMVLGCIAILDIGRCLLLHANQEIRLHDRMEAMRKRHRRRRDYWTPWDDD